MEMSPYIAVDEVRMLRFCDYRHVGVATDLVDETTNLKLRKCFVNSKKNVRFCYRMIMNLLKLSVRSDCAVKD